MRLAIFSAFPQEIKQLVRDFRPVEKLNKRSLIIYFARYSSRDIIVVQAGMGARSTEAAFKYITEEHSPDLILSVGFGGAIYDKASAGDIICASRVFLIPENILERSTAFDSRNLPSEEIPEISVFLSRISDRVRMYEGCILTFERYVEKAEIKKFLPADLPFPVCDMETYFLAKLSKERGLRFLALRAITDRADEEIPREFLSVTDESGRYRLSRALRLILGRPKIIKDIMRIGRNAKIASSNLSDAVRSLIEVL